MTNNVNSKNQIHIYDFHFYFPELNYKTCDVRTSTLNTILMF